MKRTCLLLTLLCFLAPLANAADFPDFSEVKNAFCNRPDSPDNCAELVTENMFIKKLVDINADKTPEAFYATKDGCGAHMNCDFFIFKKQNKKWVFIGTGLGQQLWQESTTQSSHHDLTSRCSNSACSSSFERWVWNGKKYKSESILECDYCQFEDDKIPEEQWPAVCRNPWWKNQNMIFNHDS